MRDFLSWSKWWNKPLSNPTQNRYSRFLKSPLTGLPDYVGDVVNDMGLGENNLLKTRYGNVLED